jgi:hypothetical protein
VLLQFFELSTDALNFDLQAQQFGIRRFQSLALVSGSLIYLLWARYGLKAFLTRQGLILVPVGVVLIALGLMSGHRYLLIILIMTFVFCSYVQRLFLFRNVLMVSLAILLGLSAVYIFSERLPLAAQRAISFLPGIEVHSVANHDAQATWQMRHALRRIGMELAPQYFWVGRGLGLSSTGETMAMASRDLLAWHVSIGRFYNGFVGLLVNTGIFGTIFMLTLLAGGTVLALRIARLLRANRWEDHFALVCSVIVALWMARALGWLFLHGDSEWALRNFGLQVGLMVACHYHLTQRPPANSDSDREAVASSG